MNQRLPSRRDFLRGTGSASLVALTSPNSSTVVSGNRPSEKSSQNAGQAAEGGFPPYQFHVQHHPSVEEYATVEAITNGVPVWSFSNLCYIYGASPDLVPDVVMQEGNRHPLAKIKLKKSWEIKSNLCGAEAYPAPRTAYNDSQPMLPIHLIDGDPNTAWASFEYPVADARLEWIRIDLPIEAEIASAALVTADYQRPSYGNYGKALPKELEVKLSRDASHWETAYSNQQINPDPRVVDIRFPPRRAKQIWIIGNHFPSLTSTGNFDQSRHVFSIGEVEVRDSTGANLALVSRGASVTVSSTSYIFFPDRLTQDALWNALNYDLGNKWVKLGDDNGPYLWYQVEREKGKIEIDSRADEAITELVRHGINVEMILDFKGNWIYQNPPRKTNWLEARFREINDTYTDPISAADANPEMYQQWLRYIECMANHFKDRVTYFELGNEWNAWFGPEHYVKTFFEPAYQIVKRVAPNAKIMLGSPAGFDRDVILECLGVQRDTGLSGGRLLLDPKGVQPAGIEEVAPPERRLGAAALRTDLELSDVVASAEFENQGEPGIVLRYKDQKNYIAAFHSAVRHSIAIHEVVNASACGGVCGPFGTETPNRVEKRTGNLGPNIKLVARAQGGMVSLTVSDGTGSFSIDYSVRFLKNAGSVGVFQRLGNRPQRVGHFRVTDSQGRVLAKDDFSGPDGGIPVDWKYVAGGPNSIPPGSPAVSMPSAGIRAVSLTPPISNRLESFRRSAMRWASKGTSWLTKSTPVQCTRPGQRRAT